MLYIPRWTLEAMEGGIGLEVLEVPEVMCCALICTLEAVEDTLCLPEVVEVMRCESFCTRLWRLSSVFPSRLGRRVTTNDAGYTELKDRERSNEFKLDK